MTIQKPRTHRLELIKHYQSETAALPVSSSHGRGTPGRTCQRRDIDVVEVAERRAIGALARHNVVRNLRGEQQKR